MVLNSTHPEFKEKFSTLGLFAVLLTEWHEAINSALIIWNYSQQAISLAQQNSLPLSMSELTISTKTKIKK